MVIRCQAHRFAKTVSSLSTAACTTVQPDAQARLTAVYSEKETVERGQAALARAEAGLRPKVQARMDGYTDNIGGAVFDRRLSLERANAVKANQRDQHERTEQRGGDCAK